MLKKIDLGQALGIFANVGVIVGIAFLAFELRQNNEALNLQARLEREDTVRQGLLRRVQNPDLIAATARVMREEPLSLEDELLLDDLNRGALMDWWLAYHQVQDGVLAAESLPLSGWRYYFHHEFPRMDESWADFKLLIPQEVEYFRWFEENIVSVSE